MRNSWRRWRVFSVVVGAVALCGSVAAQALPDLIVNSIDRSQVAQGTESLSLSGNLQTTIKNIGAGSAQGTVNVLAFYDAKRLGVYNPHRDQVLGIGRVTLNLGAGQVAPVTIGLSGGLPFRDAPISVVVDSHKEMSESNDRNNVRSSAGAGRALQDVATAPPQLKWNWTGSQAYPGYNKVHAMTTVGPLDDTNGDGKYDSADEPRVLAVAWSTAYYVGGYLHVLSGKTGAELRVFPQLVQAGVAPAIADLDGDGVPEIITMDQSRRLIALNRDLSVKWVSTISLPSSTVNWGGVTVADLDGDGAPELIWGNHVFNANGALKWVATTSNYGGHCCFHGDFFSAPVVTRLTAGGPQVLLLGAAAFSANGTKLWENAAVGDGLVAVGDLDKDGVPEIVLLNATGNKLYALRPDGTVKWGPIPLREALVPFSPPVIADFNGDGFPDVGVLDVTLTPNGADGLESFVSTFDRHGNLIWTQPIDATTGTPAGAVSAFDFDANGTTHPLVVGKDQFKFLSGVNGTVLAQVSAAGYFATHPVSADADGDGVADVLVSSTAFSGFVPSGVLAYSNPAWAGTRKAWNQYAYSISNINDDMSVPRNPLASWQDSNTFRINRPIAVSAGGGVDISASRLRLLKDKCRNDDDDDDDCRCSHDHVRKGGSLRVSVRIGNAGTVEVPKKVSVAVYGETRTGITWLGNGKTNEKLQPGEYDDVKISIRSAAGVLKLIVVADDDGTGTGTLAEANRVNNRAEISLNR